MFTFVGVAVDGAVVDVGGVFGSGRGVFVVGGVFLFVCGGVRGYTA